MVDGQPYRKDVMPPRNRGAVIRAIQRTAPLGAPRPSDPMTIGRLTSLTGELIGFSGGMQVLAQKDPYREVLERRLPVEPSVAERLRGKKIFITGGEGL